MAVLHSSSDSCSLRYDPWTVRGFIILRHMAWQNVIGQTARRDRPDVKMFQRMRILDEPLNLNKRDATPVTTALQQGRAFCEGKTSTAMGGEGRNRPVLAAQEKGS